MRSGAETFLVGTASCRIEVDDVEALFEEYAVQGVLYDTDTRVEKTPWNTREFPALDLHRKLVTFFEPIPGWCRVAQGTSDMSTIG